MNILFEYISYLLPQHNCVVIPELGGFVVNLEPAKFTSNAYLNPPTYSIVFNSDLQYDDGILTSFVMRDEGISYNAASQKIKSYVKSVKSDLTENGFVDCHHLGSLHLDDNEILTFKMNKSALHPKLIGLTPSFLEKIAVINHTEDHKLKSSKIRYFVSGAAAAVAAILLLTIPSVNIENHESHVSNQQAGFIQSISEIVSSPVDNIPVGLDELANIDETKNISGRTYYIIIAGEESSARANKLLDKIKSTDFPSASIIESSDRIRIYATSFGDKEEAERYLTKLRDENPKYATAWLYSKKNK